MTAAPHPVDVHVGNRLRSRRADLGMSQETLGNASEITFQQIQKYEKGTNRISASKLYELAGTLGVEPGYFFEGIPAGVRRSAGRRRPGRAK